MSQLLGLSFDGVASPSIALKNPSTPAAGPTHSGWGFAWYPPDSRAAAVIKDPKPYGETAMTRVLRDWDRFRGGTFICHLRGAAQRFTQQDTHPFSRSHGGRDWLMAHNGQLQQEAARQLDLGLNPVYEPLGRTDTEQAFCWILEKARAAGYRRLADFGWETLHGLLRELNALGTANFLLSDGQDLVAYSDASGFRPLHVGRQRPPNVPEHQGNSFITLNLASDTASVRSLFVIVTTPFEPGAFTQLAAGEMIVVRQAAVIWSSDLAQRDRLNDASAAPAGGSAAPGRVQQAATPATLVGPRRLRVLHRTVYTYTDAVERSSHQFCLTPFHGPGQTTLFHRLTLSVDAETRRFEDVFGNAVLSARIATPYTRLEIDAESLVELDPVSPVIPLERRTQLPLVWMPWQRQMMVPYLLPPELPEPQLRELSRYAMSFAERQDYDLAEVVRDINQTLHRDFDYVSGSTTLSTTPFDVYMSRRGVCQDFANLFVCLARLLNIPARYQAGYLFTGGNYENTIQGDASHAWVQVYLPSIGWRGYDPTNGCLTGQDHIRVAVGRNFGDATPTSGTIYRGGGDEILEVTVKVTEEPAAG